MGLMDIFKIKEYKNTINNLTQQNNFLSHKLYEIGAERYDEVTNIVNQLNHTKDETQNQINNLNSELRDLADDIEAERGRYLNLKKKNELNDKKMRKSTDLYRSIGHAVKRLSDAEIYNIYDNTLETELDELYPSVTLHLRSMDIKPLRQAFRDNDAQINKLLKAYQGRYTTKANLSIYNLIVLGLRSELQNILYNLKYEKLADATDKIKVLTDKYRSIAHDGNQTIAKTLISFIDQMEYLFINAVKIEYNYYVKKQQEKEARILERQKLREEKQEREALKKEKARIETEELKYQQELEKNRLALDGLTDEEEIKQYQKRILELEQQLSDVTIKKDEISNLMHGKAGTVYIISNKGAFGENIFKIGMTRRIDPQERINELGSASVPFRFDVHSFIFSNDAVALETELHKRLDSKRINKVNMRKEFFYSTLEELEEIVSDVEPTAEFVNIMTAEEYNQSLSSDENYTTVYDEDDVEEDDDYDEEE